MDPARLMRTCGVAIGAIHAIAGVAVWLVAGLPGALLLFGPCALITLAIGFAAAPLLRRPPPPDGDGGAGTPGAPPEPPWWPEFERAFRAYDGRSRTPA